MPSVPKGSCKACRIVKETAKKINNNMRKHIMIYAFFYLIAFEYLTILIQNKVSEQDYVYYYYPLFTQLALVVIFYNLWLFRDRLKFCSRKKIAVASLVIYYLLGSLTIYFQWCYTWYLCLINNLLLLTTAVTLLLTIVKQKK